MPRNHSHLNILHALFTEMLSSIPFVPRAFTAIESVLASAMGCIFSCFAFNDNADDYSPPEEVRRDDDDRSSLILHFLSEEEDLSTPIKEDQAEKRKSDFEELKDEAQFLKACGTILEIPSEIQEVVGQQNELSSQKGAVGSPKFKSWLTGNFVEELVLDSPPDLSPVHVTNCEVYSPPDLSPVHVTNCEELVEEVDLPHTPNSDCSSPNSTEIDETAMLLSSPSQSPINPPLSSDVTKCEEYSPPDLSTVHVTNSEEWVEEVDLPHTPNSECSSPNSTEVDETAKLLSSPGQSPINPPLSSDVIVPSTVKKSVSFSCEPKKASVLARSPSETSSQTSDEHGSSRSFTYRKSSPYPTPLKLVDEMETPGTIFPAYMDMDTVGQGKHPRIRSQFVHSAVHPAESFLPNLMNSVTRKPLVEVNGYGNSGIGENSVDAKELNLEASLSPWLKGRPSTHDASAAFQDENSDMDSTPILGVVSSQYDGDESFSIIPKWRDWNGIPNTTNKYKEDQKVCWHATPFEERLEKALSEDTLIAQRRQSSSSNQQLIL